MSVSRRSAVLLSIAALAASSLPAVAAEPVVIRAIRIDTSGIAARGLPAYARHISEVAQEVVGPQLGSLVQPNAKGGATLVIHIDSVSLDPDSTSGSSRSMRDNPLDWVEGSWELVAANGARIKGDKLTTNYPSGITTTWYAPDNELLRQRAAVGAFFYWVKRAL